MNPDITIQVFRIFSTNLWRQCFILDYKSCQIFQKLSCIELFSSIEENQWWDQGSHQHIAFTEKSPFLLNYTNLGKLFLSIQMPFCYECFVLFLKREMAKLFCSHILVIINTWSINISNQVERTKLWVLLSSNDYWL